MKTVPLKEGTIFGALNFVQMDKDEKPPVEDVVTFAKANAATYSGPNGQGIFLVLLCDESVFCGMNKYTLEAGLTL